MAKLDFTKEELNHYFNGALRHKAYGETVKLSNDYRIHAEGIFPEGMISERRPSESTMVKDYRKKIWKANTKPVWGKVVTELNKIRRSSEWMVKFNDAAVPAKILPGETLKDYCEKNFPLGFTSMTNWTFSLLLPLYLKDPNAVVVVMPLERSEFVKTEYVKPFPYTFNSWQVIDYVPEDYAVLKSTDRVIYQDSDGSKHYGNVFYIVTTMYVHRYEESRGSNLYQLTWRYSHNLGELPAFRVKSVMDKSYDSTYINKSRLDDMMPRLDEAVREYSDLQAEVVQHIFNEKWETATDDCLDCKGQGKIRTAGIKGELIDCPTCDGSGARPRGPYSTIKVRPPMAGEKPVNTPPAGYIEKDVTIVKIQDERIDKHEFKALSAINMEYLAKTPLNESGKAKEVDKDALNTFVNAVAEDIVWTIDKIYYFINEQRYSIVVPDKDKRRDMLPYIPVPEKFDLLSSTYLEEQISKQKENKGNPIIINAMEEEYVNKKFAYDYDMKERVLLSIRLDPLSGVGEDDRASRVAQGGITQVTYVLSCNIREFIDRAIDEKGEAFFTMKPKEQKELLRSYAREQVEQNTASTTVISGFTETHQPDESHQEE